MPDHDSERNRQLKRIADATERQIRLMEVLNKNIVQLGVHAVPVLENINKLLKFLEGTDEADTTVSTGQLKIDENAFALEAHKDCSPGWCKIAAQDSEFSADDCPMQENYGTISVLIGDLSYKEVQDAGYAIFNSNVGPFIRVPRLNKDPNDAPTE